MRSKHYEELPHFNPVTGACNCICDDCMENKIPGKKVDWWEAKGAYWCICPECNGKCMTEHKEKSNAKPQ